MSDLIGVDRALAIAAAFRSTLLGKAGVLVPKQQGEKRSNYELACHALGLDTRHEKDRLLQNACQVIDDLTSALQVVQEQRSDAHDFPNPGR